MLLVKTAVKLFKSRISLPETSNRHYRHICFEVYSLSKTKQREDLGTNWLGKRPGNKAKNKSEIFTDMERQ